VQELRARKALMVREAAGEIAGVAGSDVDGPDVAGVRAVEERERLAIRGPVGSLSEGNDEEYVRRQIVERRPVERTHLGIAVRGDAGRRAPGPNERDCQDCRPDDPGGRYHDHTAPLIRETVGIHDRILVCKVRRSQVPVRSRGNAWRRQRAASGRRGPAPRGASPPHPRRGSRSLSAWGS
jgi:hypothetical protein